ncbi:MAG: hypothetical protein GY847_08950 [Proteobacteria bacterium]|nr:hypothetical protein [Pseudomonadota bacterium]
MEHPVSVDKLSPQVAKVCGPGAPPPLKAMAADGLAPLGPIDLVTVLYVLAYDGDKKLADKAAASLAGMPEGVLSGAVDKIQNEQVLDGLVRLLVGRPGTMEKAVLNRSLADETALWIAAGTGNEKILDTIATNEERLLRYPLIIEALYNNKAARMSTVDRAVELAVRNDIELSGIASFAEVKAAITGEPITESEKETNLDDSFFKENMDQSNQADLDEEEVDKALSAREKGKKEETETARKIETVEQTLSQLSIAAKIRVATLGSGSQRAVLIRDSNKLVSMAVVRSPGIRESEILQYSRFRSLPEEVVRYMSGNREWTKHYQVKLNLVQNPRCPLEISMRFLPHLRANDVRALERDKNIPGAIAKAAKQLRAKRMR